MLYFAYMRRKKLLFAGVVLAAVIAGAAMFAAQKTTVFAPKTKEITSYGDGTWFYECSKPIKARLVDSRSRAPESSYYLPVDQDEARLFCHSAGAIEYKGKLKVLQKPEVLALVKKYPYKDVTIKALEFKYIQDKQYVHRLLPAYSDQEIGCIIVLDTPGEDKVYLENEELNTFRELDYQTFARNLEQVSQADRQTFYDNLK